jgi:hypothetical protein
MRLARTFVVPLALLAFAPVTVVYVRELDAIDRCLDAGGSFDYAAMRCDHQTNHAAVPFTDRHRTLVLATWGTLAGLAVAAAVTRQRRRPAAPPSRPVV